MLQCACTRGEELLAVGNKGLECREEVNSVISEKKDVNILVVMLSEKAEREREKGRKEDGSQKWA